MSTSNVLSARDQAAIKEMRIECDPRKQAFLQVLRGRFPEMSAVEEWELERQIGDHLMEAYLSGRLRGERLATEGCY